MTINDAAKRFLEHLELDKGYARGTIKAYRGYLDLFTAYAADHKVEDIAAVNLGLVSKYRNYLAHLTKPSGSGRWPMADTRQQSLKKVSQGYYLMALRGMLRYLSVRLDMNVLNAEKIGLPKTSTPLVSFLNPEQLDRLLSVPNVRMAGRTRFKRNVGLRDRTIMEMLWSTGLRVSELVSLNRDQINLERREFGIVGKGSKPRVVFLSDDAAKWIKRYLATRNDSDKALFVGYRGTKLGRLSSRAIQQMIEIYATQCKLPGNITPHTLRHTFATDLLRNGADIRSVQEMLGHSSIVTTQRYTHVTDRQLGELHERYHAKWPKRRGRKSDAERALW